MATAAFDLPIMATAVFDLPIMATAVGVNSCRTRGRIMLLVLISNDDADTLVPDQSTTWEQNKTVFKQIPTGVLKVLFLYRLLDTVHSTAINSRLATHHGHLSPSLPSLTFLPITQSLLAPSLPSPPLPLITLQEVCQTDTDNKLLD